MDQPSQTLLSMVGKKDEGNKIKKWEYRRLVLGGFPAQSRALLKSEPSGRKAGQKASPLSGEVC